MKNPEMTLKAWRNLLDFLEGFSKYPSDTILYIDAGRNDCQLVIKEKK